MKMKDAEYPVKNPLAVSVTKLTTIFGPVELNVFIVGT
jgi:hypothetical protein